MTLQERYQTMPDEQLELIALHEAGDLTPEALNVLRAEVRRRSLGEALGSAVEVQTRPLSPHDVSVLVEQVRQQPCPQCGRRDGPVNASIVARATGLLLVTIYEPSTSLGCAGCLGREAFRAALFTALLGWWAFPMGPIRTVQALGHNITTMRLGMRRDASKALIAYVQQNPGEATAFVESHCR
ncbi:MAG: hypothetical protein AAF624_16565 [Bacteroidota bacterium]